MGGKSSKKKAEEPVPAGPLDLLVEGGKVYLTSKASSKLLQVHEGNIDALGEEGESAQFTVSKKDSESGHVVTLQNGDKYLNVTEEKVELCEESSELKVVEAEEGCVLFESGKTAGRYLSVQEDGAVQSGTEVGTATYFTVASAVKTEEPPPADAAPAATQEEPTQQTEEAVVENEQEKTEEKGEEQESKEPEQGEAQEEQPTSES